MSKKLLAVLLASLLTAGATAATRYVTDEFKVTLRAGPSTGHKIVKTLSSGTKVSTLKVDGASGYTQVRTGEGKTGWILTRQLVDKPVARDRLLAAEKRFTQADKRVQQAETRVSELETAATKLQAAHDQLVTQKRGLETQLAKLQRTASNALAIAAERDELLGSNTQLTEQVRQLSGDNKRLSGKSQQRWFLIGAGVLFAGFMLGLILPKLRPRRKSSWGSL